MCIVNIGEVLQFAKVLWREFETMRIHFRTFWYFYEWPSWISFKTYCWQIAKLGTRYRNIRKGKGVNPGYQRFFLACAAIGCGGDASGLVSRGPTRILFGLNWSRSHERRTETGNRAWKVSGTQGRRGFVTKKMTEICDPSVSKCEGENMQRCFTTRFAAMLKMKLHVFVNRFTVALWDQEGKSTLQSRTGSINTQQHTF